MEPEARSNASAAMMPGILASAQHLAAGDENLFESLANLRMLTNYIWWFTEAHGGKEVALLPEQERLAMLPGARPINPDLRIIASSLERVSVRTMLLKFMSAKTVQDFLDAAERYDEWLETLELSLNHEFLAMVVARMEPHMRETENAV